MNASATARFDGGRAMELLIQVRKMMKPAYDWAMRNLREHTSARGSHKNTTWASRYSQRDVPGGDAHRGNGDDEADDPEGERNRDVPESFARAIGVPAQNKCHDRRKCPWRCAEEECDGGVVAHSCAQCREEGVEGEGDDQAGEGDGKPPDLPVREREIETMEATKSLCLLLITDTDILLHTLLGKADLKRTQPAVRSRREIGENENGAESREHGESAFDVEQPPARL